MTIKSSSEFAKVLLEGDQWEALKILHAWQECKSRFNIYNELITPAMYTVGELWEKNEITVADEHLATAVCDFVITQTEQQFKFEKNNDLRKALFPSIVKEHHYLGLKMVSILFNEWNWDVRFLQSPLPIEHLIIYVNKWKPDLIGLSFSNVTQIEVLKQYLEQLHSHVCYNPEIIIGGRLIGKYDFTSLILNDNMRLIPNLYDLQSLYKNNG
ncbi:cobalamin B12-binding domain-containing protein [Evansella cellulosilytica]|uniref:Cobalamin B12-binding domain protein n=1 Tax=Evansella cellulosilytica (strain ATCC 21833 / DSM 2522 / FERM P-1141 / JCM 9156 / N-4) TaxID=649639 RepID=E6U266_EVAC2|nr:cobalamin B12-binding domain-containing protein [Evansella cellulosilytica]ADU30444.1 cobalamin B12-binding domain protein [Evansella cellulosilytica DSM 2522]